MLREETGRQCPAVIEKTFAALRPASGSDRCAREVDNGSGVGECFRVNLALARVPVEPLDTVWVVSHQLSDLVAVGGEVQPQTRADYSGRA